MLRKFIFAILGCVCFCGVGYSDNVKVVRGTVKYQDGSPVMFANVFDADNNRIGVATNAQGAFVIDTFPLNHTKITVSSIEIKPVTVDVKDGNMEIVVDHSSIQLQAVEIKGKEGESCDPASKELKFPDKNATAGIVVNQERIDPYTDKPDAKLCMPTKCTDGYRIDALGTLNGVKYGTCVQTPLFDANLPIVWYKEAIESAFDSLPKDQSIKMYNWLIAQEKQDRKISATQVAAAYVDNVITPSVCNETAEETSFTETLQTVMNTLINQQLSIGAKK